LRATSDSIPCSTCLAHSGKFRIRGAIPADTFEQDLLCGVSGDDVPVAVDDNGRVRQVRDARHGGDLAAGARHLVVRIAATSLIEQRAQLEQIITLKPLLTAAHTWVA
jgi:hypothetical protein